MDKLYKYWLYYINDELYAYTDRKEYAKSFESFRNMKKFHRIKKEINKDTVNMLAKEYQTQYLQKHTLKTYKDKKWIDIEIILTESEHLTITSIGMVESYEGISSFCFVNPFIFNDEILNALTILNYVSIYQSLSNDLPKGIKSKNPIECMEDMKIDELGIFIETYGYTI